MSGVARRLNLYNTARPNVAGGNFGFFHFFFRTADWGLSGHNDEPSRVRLLS